MVDDPIISPSKIQIILLIWELHTKKVKKETLTDIKSTLSSVSNNVRLR